MNYLRHTLCYLGSKALPVSLNVHEELDFLATWTAQGFPLIATRQPATLKEKHIQLAIPYLQPFTHKKLRMSYVFLKTAIQQSAELPYLHTIFPQASAMANPIRVYGSYCWQYLTHHHYVRPDSDLDILIEYSNQSIATLQELYYQLTTLIPGIKIDGEIRFPSIGDCAYLELIYQQEIPDILFKSQQDIRLISRDDLYVRFPTLLS